MCRVVLLCVVLCCVVLLSRGIIPSFIKVYARGSLGFSLPHVPLGKYGLLATAARKRYPPPKTKPERGGAPIGSNLYLIVSRAQY